MQEKGQAQISGDVDGDTEVLTRGGGVAVVAELTGSTQSRDNATFTWNHADSGWRETSCKRHGQNKQSDGLEGRQNEVPMTMCCYGDVVLFIKNRMKYF